MTVWQSISAVHPAGYISERLLGETAIDMHRDIENVDRV
jgi:hypothetical protein